MSKYSGIKSCAAGMPRQKSRKKLDNRRSSYPKRYARNLTVTKGGNSVMVERKADARTAHGVKQKAKNKTATSTNVAAFKQQQHTAEIYRLVGIAQVND